MDNSNNITIFTTSSTKHTLRNIQEHLLYSYEKCPICNKSQNALYGYPNRVCSRCLEKFYVYDEPQNRVLVGNLGIAGGIQVFELLEDNCGNLIKREKSYQIRHKCMINGITCIVEECKYGGVQYMKL